MSRRTGGGLIGALLTDKGVVNSTTETDVANWLLPAATLLPGDSLRFQVYGDLGNSSGSNVTFTWKLYLGATALLTSNAFSIATSASRTKWQGFGDVVFTDLAAQRAGMSLQLSGASSTVLPITTGEALAVGFGSATENVAAVAKTLRLTATLGTAVATADCYGRLGTLVLHRP